MPSHTAGIIVIGDEILKGQTVDTNSPFMSKRLHALGVKLCKISVVPDDVDVIASETSIFSKKYDIVLTSGGIGPTHDDVTYEATAKAFNTPLVLNKEIAEFIGMFFHGSTTDVIENPALKMAMIPESATLIYPRDTTKRRKSSFTFYDMPTVRVSNVYIFAGLPNQLQYAFSQLEHLFSNLDNRKFYVRCLYFNKGETELVPCLNRAVETFKKDVTFGSYPIIDNDVYCTKITMEAVVEEHVLEAENFLKRDFPACWVVNPDSLSAESVIVSVYDTAVSVPNSRLSEMVKNSLKVLTDCFERFSAREVFISFNGGKDCTVLLHLACAVLWSQQPQERENRLQALYIRYNDPFPEVEKFIEETVVRYNLELKVVPSPIKTALEVVLDERPDLKAVLMGTRRTDPYADTLQSFQMTDSGWPQVMRVNPLLDWDYQDVWGFLQLLGIPYCSLYDDGYTSIGSRHNTTPNPQLKYTDSSGETRYQPAFMLQDGAAERSGRL
ncbi:FAD synthase isoform X2 [Anabrus simplex]|uniref:FAD synthase isoform X2 n=1 Tax=Anabrus simplex TaxID=316456 RepID=UPI0035A2E24F